MPERIIVVRALPFPERHVRLTATMPKKERRQLHADQPEPQKQRQCRAEACARGDAERVGCGEGIGKEALEHAARDGQPLRRPAPPITRAAAASTTELPLPARRPRARAAAKRGLARGRSSAQCKGTRARTEPARSETQPAATDAGCRESAVFSCFLLRNKKTVSLNRIRLARPCTHGGKRIAFAARQERRAFPDFGVRGGGSFKLKFSLRFRRCCRSTWSSRSRRGVCRACR